MDPLDHFKFSQSSLQDYHDCRRRFQLRYLMRVAWPALQAEPIQEFEQLIQRGERFHRLAQQYLLGIPQERLTQTAIADEDEHLVGWWQHFLESVPGQLEGKRHVETALSSPLGPFRLVAVYDLLIFSPTGQVEIFDWKTSTHRPKASTLLQRMQTRVYPYLLVRAGRILNGAQEISPDQVSMTYWFADPDMPAEKIPYSLQQYEEDGKFFLSVAEEIRSLKPEEFSMATDDHPCRFCAYRSLCNRGTSAADFNQEDADIDAIQSDTLDFNFEQIGEVSY